MIVKLFDSELKVMNVFWNQGDCTAKHISNVLKEEIGWNMNTTYTLIKRCIKKGAILRAISTHKLPKKTFLFLWGLVLFRMLIPLSIPSVFSIYSLIPKSDMLYVSEQKVSEVKNYLPRVSVTSDMIGDNITKNVETQGLF